MQSHINVLSEKTELFCNMLSSSYNYALQMTTSNGLPYPLVLAWCSVNPARGSTAHDFMHQGQPDMELSPQCGNPDLDDYVSKSDAEILDTGCELGSSCTDEICTNTPVVNSREGELHAKQLFTDFSRASHEPVCSPSADEYPIDLDCAD